ncbi:MAG: RecX family transcriptional regulator [Firmicutes bacterium]|nr:RecX family transcriptional regulator [Bacillota bacterium]
MKLYLIKKKKDRKYSSEACAKAAAGVTLEHDVSGRPVAIGGPFVSVSDTKNWWALLTADSPCGLDLEEGGRSLTAASAKKLHALEQQYLAGLEPLSSEWREEFLSIWVRKEAYMKFCGEGLRMGLAKFSVLDADLNYAKTVQAKNYPAAQVGSIDPGRGLYAAVALETPEVLESVELCPYEGQTEREIMDEAADLLAGRAYLSGDLQKKLRTKGYDAEETAETIDRLQELGYLDDEAYAKSFASDAARKGKGKLRIARELAQKGADAATAKAAIEAVSEEEDQLSERERAMEAAQKMLRGAEKPDEKMLARIGRRLSSLGYEPSVIWDVLGKLKS